MRAHDIELVHPFYGSKDGHTAFCVCGWASEEYPTPGTATLAGWAHLQSDGVRHCNPELQETA